MAVDAPEDAAVQKLKVTRASLKPAENSIVCYLRLHPEVAETYGITVGGDTSAGSMLLQTLEAQGMDVTWYERLPNNSVVHDNESVANQRAAGYIKTVGKRPGARIKQLSERPKVAPPDKAAIARHHGVLPRVSFPLLLQLSKSRRRREFTSCGNRIRPPAAVALVERCQLVDFVQSKLRCECGARLRYCKAASHQVSAAGNLKSITWWLGGDIPLA